LHAALLPPLDASGFRLFGRPAGDGNLEIPLTVPGYNLGMNGASKFGRFRFWIFMLMAFCAFIAAIVMWRGTTRRSQELHDLRMQADGLRKQVDDLRDQQK
jgi:hypothetical protein